MSQKQFRRGATALGLAAFMCASTNAGMTNTVVPVDISNSASWDELGDPNNVVQFVDLASSIGLAPGSAVTITALGFDVNLQTVGGSILNDIAVNFGTTAGAGSLWFVPSTGDAGSEHVVFPGPGQLADLTDFSLPNIYLSNGILRLEFYEQFDDFPNAIDAFWTAPSTIFVGVQQVPEPATLALLGLGVIGSLRTRFGRISR